MTTLIINGKDTHEITTHEGQSLLDILLAAQEKYWGTETSILKLSIDGQAMVPIDEQTLSKAPAEAQTMEVWLEENKERTVNEIVTEAVQYLTHLEKGLEELASKIRLEGDKKAYELLRDGLEGLSQVVSLFGLLQEKSARSDEQVKRFAGFIKDLEEKCTEMTEAQESHDPTLIADILEYELVESVGELREQMASLAT